MDIKLFNAYKKALQAGKCKPHEWQKIMAEMKLNPNSKPDRIKYAKLITHLPSCF